jgi:hypothetical protein
MLATAEHVDAMVNAFADQTGRLVRHRLTPEVTQALEAAVAGSPGAATRTDGP